MTIDATTRGLITNLHKTMMMQKLNKAHVTSPWGTKPADEGDDMIGQKVAEGDVVMTVIDDKMVLMSVVEIREDELWRKGEPMRHVFKLVRYKSKRKQVKIDRSGWGIFKVGPEQIAAAVLSGRLQ